jgi:hypothetical protein
MRKLLALVVPLALGLLAGCLRPNENGETAPILSQVPTESATFAAEYQRLAECAYRSLDNPSGGSLKKADLPTARESRVSLDSGGFRQWELIFKSTDATHTQVSLSKVQTIWGPLGGNDAMPAVRACALGGG